MVRAIIVWSLHNRFVVLLGVVALIGVGIHSALNLNIEAYPDPTPPLVEVITQNPGASPEEMERQVGVILETALNGMPGLEDLRSTSVAGLNDIKCQFAYGTDYWSARQEVINRITQVTDLPQGVTPGLSPWSPTGEIVRYVLESENPQYSTNDLKAVQDWVLNRALKQVPGVIDVTGYGGTIKQYQVLVDPRLLRQYGITIDQVETAIQKSNANIGGNLLAMGSQTHNVRVIGLIGGAIDPLDPARVDQGMLIETNKLHEVEDVVISSNKDIPIKVRQVAKVVVGHRPRLGKVARRTKDGEAEGVRTYDKDEDDVVEGIVLMRKYEKSVATSDAVQAKIEEIERTHLLPKGMHIQSFNRRTDLVEVTKHNVLHNLVVGMGLVILVLFVFLGDITSAAIVALMIPLALLFSITVLYVQGKSANLLSIGAVDFGIIVDSSVIIVENIFRHVTSAHTDRSRPLVDRIAEASAEIEKSLFFSTTIIICAFIPLFAMTGPEGALFGPMANTYAFAIFGALILAVTLSPVLCSLLYSNNKQEKITYVDRIMKRGYLRALNSYLNHRWAVLLVMGALLAFTVTLIPGLGGEFMPQMEEGNLWIRVTMPRTTSLEESARIAPKLRDVMASIPEVRGVMSHVGRPDDGTDVTSFFNLEFNVPLKPMEQWRSASGWLGKLGYKKTRADLEAELQEKFKEYPGLSFNFSQLIRDNVEEALSGVKGANSIKLFGNDLDTLEQVGARVVNILRSVRGIENVGLFHIIGQPNMEIRIDREKCSRYGINVADVESVVQVAIGGQAFSQMVEGEKKYDIVLRFPESLRDDPAGIDTIAVDVPSTDGKAGIRVPLRDLATIEPHKPGASYIYRENNQRFIPIKFSVEGRDLASAINEARRKVDDPKAKVVPDGYRVEWSGEFEQMQKANQRLMWIVPLSITLIMILLYTAFNSFKDALLVMANVVAACMGGIWALRICQIPFSISAAVGFISIFGVAVQDGVLLISYFNQMRAEGISVKESVLRGAELRVRPVVMTSLTAALGLLPAALATSIGSQAQKPLAIVVVGGMLVTLLLTRYLMPILYSYFPAPAGHGTRHAELMEGSHFTDEILGTSRNHAEPAH